MPKNINLTKVPHARKIENFWGCMAQKVYEERWDAKTEDKLIRRIQSEMKEFDKKNCEEPFKGG